MRRVGAAARLRMEAWPSAEAPAALGGSPSALSSLSNWPWAPWGMGWAWLGFPGECFPNFSHGACRKRWSSDYPKPRQPSEELAGAPCCPPKERAGASAATTGLRAPHLAPPLCLAWLSSQGRGQRQHSHDPISFRAEFWTRSGLAATLARQAYGLRPTLYIMFSVPTGLAGGTHEPACAPLLARPSPGFLREARFPGVPAYTFCPQEWQRQMPTGVGQSKRTTPISSVLATHLHRWPADRPRTLFGEVTTHKTG